MVIGEKPSNKKGDEKKMDNEVRNLPMKFKEGIISIMDATVCTWKDMSSEDKKIFNNDIEKFTGNMLISLAIDILEDRKKELSE